MGLFPKDRDLTRAPEEVVLPVRSSDFGIRASELQVRLDAFLGRHLKWRSRTSLQRLIRDGYVLVDASTPDRPRGTGTPRVDRRPGRRLFHGSTVVVRIPEELRLRLEESEDVELDVLYEDEWLIAVDKPPGVAVHPSGRHLTGTLIQRVHARFPEDRGAGPHASRVLKLCHRLDRETSGVVLVARQRDVHARAMAAFENRRVDKEYLAIVRGQPSEDEGLVDEPIGPARASRVGLKMTVTPEGLPSRTGWRVVERLGDCSLVACRLFTGRQHQIRVHMQAIGHPIVGDKLYGSDEDYFVRQAEGELTERDLAALELPRQALHNHRLALAHPVTGERLEVVSPLAGDLEDFLAARRVP